MTIVKISPRSNYSLNTNKIVRQIRQRGTDAQIVATIANHLEANSNSKSLKVITLLNTLRHEYTNYDGIYNRVLGRGRSEQFGIEHHEVSALVNECFMEHIITALQEIARKAQIKTAKLQRRLDNIREMAIAALEGEGYEAIEDLILALAS